MNHEPSVQEIVASSGRIERRLDEVSGVLESVQELLSSDALKYAAVHERLAAVERDLNRLLKAIFEGNGRPSMMARMDTMEQRVGQDHEHLGDLAIRAHGSDRLNVLVERLQEDFRQMSNRMDRHLCEEAAKRSEEAKAIQANRWMIYGWCVAAFTVVVGVLVQNWLGGGR